MLSRSRSNRFFRAVLTLASASAAGQVIMLLAMPLLTRLYTPEAFGVLAVFSSLMGIVLVVSSLRYEMAIPLPRAQSSASQLLVIGLLINLTVAIITAGVVSILRFKIADWTETPLLADFLWMLPIAVVAGGTYKLLNLWAVRNKDYSKIAVTKVTQSVANVCTQLLGGLTGMGAFGLILGQIVGQSAGITRLARNVSPTKLIEVSSRRRFVSLLLRYQNFPKYDTPAAGINAGSANLPNVAMAIIFGPATAGFYYLADRVLAVPMSIVGQAVGQAFFSQLRSDINEGILFHRTIRVLLCLVLLVTIPAALVFMLAEPAFVWVFGENWRAAGAFAGWLIIGLSVQFVYAPLSMILVATEGQRTNLLVQTFILVVKVLAFYLAIVKDSPILAVQYLTFGLAIGYGVGLVAVVSRAYSRSNVIND